MATLNQILDYQADRAEAGNWYNYYATKALSANTEGVVQSINIPAGTYLILSFMDLNAGISSNYNHNLDNRTVRSSGAGGGGSVNWVVFSENAPRTIQVKAYVASSVTARNTVAVIKLSDTVTKQN